MLYRILLYRIVWFSVIHQQESAMDTPLSLPPRPPPLSLLNLPFSLSWRVMQQIPTGSLFCTWCCKFLCSSLHTSLLLPPLLPPCPEFCSLCLFLYSCPENKFISAISSDSIYICQYMIFIFLFLSYFTLHNGL